MKTYRRHNCDRQHRNENTFMKCAIPNAVWVQGTGPYAVIAWCRVPSVSLWKTPAEAAHALEHIASACGGICQRNHDLVRVDITGGINV